MEGGDDYHKFVTKFLHLVSEAQVSEPEYKYELNMNLFFALDSESQMNNSVGASEMISQFCGQFRGILRYASERS